MIAHLPDIDIIAPEKPGEPASIDVMVRAIRRVAARQVFVENADRDRVYADNLRLEAENARLRHQLSETQAELRALKPKWGSKAFGHLPAPADPKVKA